MLYRVSNKLYYLNGFSSHDEKLFSTLCHETGELFTKNGFNFISLFNFDADSHRVDGTFNQNPFVCVTANDESVHQKFGVFSVIKSSITLWPVHMKNKIFTLLQLQACCVFRLLERQSFEDTLLLPN